MRDSTLLRQARTTTTGMLLWVSTLTVSLPSTTAETPRRPWEAITIASHPLFLAVSIIVSYGCSCSTCTTSQGTPAAVAASFAALRYFAARAEIRFLYSSGVSVTMPGSTAKIWKGSDTVTAVTLALRAFASPIPWSTAFFDSSDPSLGIRICLYILPLPQSLDAAVRTTTARAHRLVSGDQKPQRRTPLDERKLLNPAVTPHLSGAVDDQVDAQHRIDDVIVDDEVVGVLDEGQSMCAVQYITRSATPKAALTRTINPTRSESPISR